MPKKLSLTRRERAALGLPPAEKQAAKREPKPRRDITEIIGMSLVEWQLLIKADEKRFKDQELLEKLRRKKLAAQERKAKRRNRSKSYYQAFYGQSWEIVQAEAMARANGICEICKVSNAVHVHHILPIRYFLDSEDAHYINNTLAVCLPCHLAEHRQMKHRFPLFNHLKLGLCWTGRVKLCALSPFEAKTQ